jgi:glycosyltransferase involved in cell wall biosynthesis
VNAEWLPPLDPVVSRDSMPEQPTPPPIKVLHVITKFSTGAGGNTLLSAMGMDRARYDVWIAGSTQGPTWERPLWARAESAGVRTFRLPRLDEKLRPLNDLIVLFQLMRLIRREGFTIIHTHTAKGGFLGRMAGWLCRTPVIVHTFHSFSFHDFMPARRRRAYLFLERLVRPLTDYFLAVSPRVALQATELRLAPAGRVSVVPSAIEVSEIPSQPDTSLRLEFGIPQNVPLVGTVGRLDYQKAPLDFVQMAALVARKRLDARFMMVGDGPMIEAVRAEAERLGINILLTGYRDDAARLAAGFDVFVISSLYEGLGRALTEALASGRPVAATAVNGVPDLVIPGATGLLAPPAAPDRLAECVLWLLEHPEEARQMGRRARVTVLERFDPEDMCRLIDDMYCRLLGLPRTTSAAGRIAASENNRVIVVDEGNSVTAQSRQEDGRNA